MRTRESKLCPFLISDKRKLARFPTIHINRAEREQQRETEAGFKGKGRGKRRILLRKEKSKIN